MSERAFKQPQWVGTKALTFKLVPSGLLQRKCACGQHAADDDEECAECREKREGMMQRATVDSVPVNAVPSIVDDVLNSPGQPLDEGTKAFMEPRFGHDFSKVRVHTDERAVESAQVVNALAYTAGQDVVFGAERYAPETSEGKKLLAHELTHVVQQGGRQHYNSKSLIGYPTDVFEQEADYIATSLAEGRTVSVEKQMNTPFIQQLREPESMTELPPMPFGPAAPQVVRIEIQRDHETRRSTMGWLTVGDLQLGVVELPWYNNHTDTSRIPAGTYPAHIRTDGHLGWRIELENTGPRAHIEIHAGNTPQDSRGCILPGVTREQDRVNDSRAAMQLIRQAIINAGPGARIEVIIQDPSDQPPPGPGDFPIMSGLV